MAHFYLTLPSNTSQKYYPNNTMTRYTTRLQTPVDLTGDWEVALVEIMFTRSWYTIHEEAGKFRYFDVTMVTPGEGESFDPVKYDMETQVSTGNYQTMASLVNTINQIFDNAAQNVGILVTDKITKESKTVKVIREKWPRFNYITSKNRVSMVLQPGANIILDELLQNVLGFSRNKISNYYAIPKTYVGDLAADLSGGLHGLYVYCDVLENVPVGDSLAPLLRIVDTDGKNGENLHRVFNPPRYLPLRKKTFDSIEIDIRDDTGRYISFEGGRLFVTLHFRRAPNPYFSV
jgi:hypothetical protein